MLVDSEVLTMTVSHRLLGELGLHYEFDDMMRRFVGCSSRFFRDTVEADLGHPLPADWSERSHEALFESMRRELVAVEGVREALARIPLPTAVASNSGHERIRHSLGIVGLLDRFEGVIASAEDVAEPKPAPDVYLRAAGLIGADPAACIAIDDSAFGVVAAHRAGMRVLAYEGHGPIAGLPVSDRLTRFDDMHALPGIVEELCQTGRLAAP